MENISSGQNYQSYRAQFLACGHVGPKRRRIDVDHATSSHCNDANTTSSHMSRTRWVVFKPLRTLKPIQYKLNGSNTFGTIKKRPMQGQVRPTSTNHSAKSGDIIGSSLRFSSIMKVCCVLSLETPYRSDSNEKTQHTIFHIQKKICLNYPESTAIEFPQWDSKTKSVQP